MPGKVTRLDEKGREVGAISLHYPSTIQAAAELKWNLPDMSSISTCEASSFDLRVAEIDSAVTPEVFVSASTWVSVGAAMARVGCVVEKGREFRVIVDEVGLDILKAARKIEARTSIGRAGRGARRRTKDVEHVFAN
jgi:hypothetical protein